MRQILLSSDAFLAMTSFSLAEPTGLTDQVAVAIANGVVLSDAEMAGLQPVQVSITAP